jgi:hypothetical protein
MSPRLDRRHGQIGPLPHVLTEQPIGVLVRSSLPGSVRVAEVHLDARVDREGPTVSELRALVPCEGPDELGGKTGDRLFH